jgi:L-seryl-tRNA(Ser) seleniumtransferase
MSSFSGAAVLSRRRFLGWSQAAFAALSAAGFSASRAQTLVTAESGNLADDYYEKLRVERIINAAGPATALSGAVMPAQVQRALTRAALHPVVLQDLQKASGEYIARRLHCEGAMVTSGAAAALTLATAACITAATGLKPDEIPAQVLAMK